MPGDALINVIVADGHTLTRFGLAAFVEGEDGLRLVGETGDEEELVRLVRDRRPDLVILDLNLAGAADSFGVCCRLKASTYPPRVLVHTSYNFTETAATCLLRADAHVHKDASRARLASAIRRVARRPTRGPKRPDGVARVFDADTRPGVRLTAKEREITAMMFRHGTNTEIAEVLHLSLPTVKTHVRNVLRKLGVRSRAELFAQLLLGTSKSPRGRLRGAVRDGSDPGSGHTHTRDTLANFVGATREG